MKQKGIYIIRCLQEKTVYIGSSVDIQRRWTEHKTRLNTNNHHCEQLQLAWDAYGDESFIFDILELTDEIVQQEQYWLDLFKNVYNTSRKTHNPMANPVLALSVANKLRKNRNKKGQRLQKEDVIQIKIALRDNLATITTLADIYEVSTSTIAAIKAGRNWAHVVVEGFVTGKNKKYYEQTDKIVNMYEQGHPLETIRKECNIKKVSSIYDVLNKAGVTKRRYRNPGNEVSESL